MSETLSSELMDRPSSVVFHVLVAIYPESWHVNFRISTQNVLDRRSISSYLKTCLRTKASGSLLLAKANMSHDRIFQRS